MPAIGCQLNSRQRVKTCKTWQGRQSSCVNCDLSSVSKLSFAISTALCSAANLNPSIHLHLDLDLGCWHLSTSYKHIHLNKATPSPGKIKMGSKPPQRSLAKRPAAEAAKKPREAKRRRPPSPTPSSSHQSSSRTAIPNRTSHTKPAQNPSTLTDAETQPTERGSKQTSRSQPEIRDSIHVSVDGHVSHDRENGSSSSDEPLALRSAQRSAKRLQQNEQGGRDATSGPPPRIGLPSTPGPLDHSQPDATRPEEKTIDIPIGIERSALWNCIQPSIRGVSVSQLMGGFTAEERKVFCQIMRLPKKRDITRQWDRQVGRRHRSRYIKLMTLLIRAVGIESLCALCHASGDPERQQSCTILPVEADRFEELNQICKGRCCNCFLLQNGPSVCVPQVAPSLVADPGNANAEMETINTLDTPANTTPEQHAHLETKNASNSAEPIPGPQSSAVDHDIHRRAPAAQIGRALKMATQTYIRGGKNATAQMPLQDDELDVLACEIEGAVYESWRASNQRVQNYNSQVKNLSVAIKKSTDLIISLHTGALSPAALVSMTVDELMQWRSHREVEGPEDQEAAPDSSTHSERPLQDSRFTFASRALPPALPQLPAQPPVINQLDGPEAFASDEAPGGGFIVGSMATAGDLYQSGQSKSGHMSAPNEPSPWTAETTPATADSDRIWGSPTPSSTSASRLPSSTVPQQQTDPGPNAIAEAFNTMIAVRQLPQTDRVRFADCVTSMLEPSAFPAGVRRGILELAVAIHNLPEDKQKDTQKAVLGMLQSLL